MEWLHGDARRTAIGLDLDVEALNWCLENNVNRIGADVESRISLFHGNVLQPLESKMVNINPDEIIQNLKLKDNEGESVVGATNSGLEESPKAVDSTNYLKDIQLPARDIVCAFNYSCCCLHNRKELILYFKHALGALSRKGGIFVMDLYGGTSSEGVLRMQRRFPNFTVCFIPHVINLYIYFSHISILGKFLTMSFSIKQICSLLYIRSEGFFMYI